MAKYQTKAFTNVRPVPQPNSAAIQVTPVDIEFPSVAYVADDIHEVVEVPIGVKCPDYAFIFPDVDTGTPAFAFSFGVLNAASTDLAEVWASGITAGQSTTVVRNTTSVAAQSDASTVRKLGMKITTAAATYAGATKTGQVILHLQG